MYCNKSLKIYINDLAAKLPAPGGGSAAALTGCLGAALLSMVLNFTLGKPKYAKYESYLREVLKKSEALRHRFLQLVDLDVVAYQSKNVKEALKVPLEIARLCAEAIKLCPELIKKGNKNLVSDVGVAAVFFEAGFCAAYFNVGINLKYLGNKKVSKKLKKELTKKEKIIKNLRLKVEGKVNEIIRR
jgi:formiminotetrahydrofolate cyclodeaminase